MMIISTIIPVYNKSAFLIRTIESLINSYYESQLNNISILEIVIINDGSTDDSLEKIYFCKNQFSKKNKIFFDIIDQKNQGVSAARNLGIIQAKGDYLCFLDADDLILPNYFNFLFLAFSTYENHNAFATNYIKTNNPLYEEKNSIVNITIIDDLFYEWNERLPFCASSICCKKSFIIENNLFFPVGFNSGEDLFLWIKIGLISNIVYTPNICVIYCVEDINSLSFLPKPVIGAHVNFLNQLPKKEATQSLLKIKNKLIGNNIIDLLINREISKSALLLKNNLALLKNINFDIRLLSSLFLGRFYFKLKIKNKK